MPETNFHRSDKARSVLDAMDIRKADKSNRDTKINSIIMLYDLTILSTLFSKLK